jgi:uncharacterized repeat protein (TIGR03803 family)
MIKFNWAMRVCGIFLLWATTAVALPAQTTTVAPHAPSFTTLHRFDNTDGYYPTAALVQANDGDFYGTTLQGGGGSGTVFKITPSGRLTTLHSFDRTDGDYPLAVLVQATDGNFYGTTGSGGCSLCFDGSIFEITPSGTLTTLYAFDGMDGDYPGAGLVHSADGNFYGTTEEGGTLLCGGTGCGTVFTITPGGILTTLYAFDGMDGDYPDSELVQATDGSFYGTTAGGGANGHGTVFKITTSGKLTTLHSFDLADGGNPHAGLVQGTDGDFYGTTMSGGGSRATCQARFLTGCGTVFKITPSGKLTTLHSFDGADGTYPGGLVQASDGNFYGTTAEGGASTNYNFNECGYGCGTVFKVTPSGTLMTIYSFCSKKQNDTCLDGNAPSVLIQDTSGTFYGTTIGGGANSSNACVFGCGTVFSLSVGLGPFVQTNPTSGAVGAAVNILGTKLAGATSVTFNGTAASFTVKSKSEITTTVPAGATTGKVRVTFPRGTRSSNVPFRIK